jgi:hypothetical protein
MASVEDLESFLAKSKPSVDAFQRAIQNAVESSGGYSFDGWGPEIIEDEGPIARWYMYVWQPNRPEDQDFLDLSLYLDILPEDSSSDRFMPLLEVMNMEGSISDEVRLSKEPLRLDDDAGWNKVWDSRDDLAQDVRAFVEEYSPKPTKRIWRIRGTMPGNVPIHPSIHTRKDVAKSEISERLLGVIDRATQILWDLKAKNQYTGAPGASTHLSIARRSMEEGKPLYALSRYHAFLGTLTEPILDLVNRTAGTLDVETVGGFPYQDPDE